MLKGIRQNSFEGDGHNMNAHQKTAHRLPTLSSSAELGCTLNSGRRSHEEDHTDNRSDASFCVRFEFSGIRTIAEN